MQDMFYSSHFIFRTTKDVSVEGYDVPKDSLILANLWGFMKDPDHWEDPMMFRPESFLEKTEVGLKVEKKEKFVPYGMGRKICMGNLWPRTLSSSLSKHCHKSCRPSKA